MDDLEDELDLRYLKGLDPDVYYRCPTTESLDGALRNEWDRSASILIPTEIVTDFVFAVASTVTVPVIQQPHLEALLQPADFLQSITVEHVLCSNFDVKDRLKIQRAVAKSIIEVIESVDGFKYIEYRAQNKRNTDGARFSYVFQNRNQNRNRRRPPKKEIAQDIVESPDQDEKEPCATSASFDCGGAIYLKFSLRRAAIHMVYKHNPIHSQPSRNDSDLPALVIENRSILDAQEDDTLSKKKKRKRKSKKNDEFETDGDLGDLSHGVPTSLVTPKSVVKANNKRKSVERSSKSIMSSMTKKGKRSKEPQSPLKSKRKPALTDALLFQQTAKAMPCVRCREKAIKCNEAKPTCNQCRREHGLVRMRSLVKRNAQRMAA